MPLLHCATPSAGCADASFRSGTFHLGDRQGTAPRARRRAELVPLAVIPAGACFQSTRRTARPPRPVARASTDCEPNRSGYDARMGSATRTCASVPSLIDSQTAAATKPDSGTSIRCTPLRSTATPDLETTKTLARASAVSLRSVPQLEAVGDRQADSDARRLARFAYRVEANKRNRDRANRPRSVRRDGMKDRPSATMLVPARLGTWPCSALSNTRAVMSSCLPIAGTRCAGPPATGPRRLPPAPPSHPAARFTKHNRALCSKGSLACHAHCCADPRARSAQCARQASRHPSRHPPATPLN